MDYGRRRSRRRRRRRKGIIGMDVNSIKERVSYDAVEMHWKAQRERERRRLE